jgi:hypothetical protein
MERSLRFGFVAVGLILGTGDRHSLKPATLRAFTVNQILPEGDSI